MSLPFATAGHDGSPFWDLQLEYGLPAPVQLGTDLGATHDPDFGLRLVRLTPWIGAHLDVVHWVPYVASGPVLMFRTSAPRGFDLGADLALGVDYLVSRNVSLGGHYHLGLALDGEGGLLHRGGLRAMYLWGW